MDLSKTLVKKFASLLGKENKTSDTPLQVVGTAMVNGDDIFVMIDGGSTPTPAVTTTDVNNGDRVLVTLQNRVANIVGNYTVPANDEEYISDIVETVAPTVVEDTNGITEWAKSNSELTVPTSNWSSIMPLLDSTNKYLWMRVAQYDADGAFVKVISGPSLASTMSGIYIFLNGVSNSDFTMIDGGHIDTNTLTLNKIASSGTEYAQVSSDGLKVYKGSTDTPIAEFGENISLGGETSSINFCGSNCSITYDSTNDTIMINRGSSFIDIYDDQITIRSSMGSVEQETYSYTQVDLLGSGYILIEGHEVTGRGHTRIDENMLGKLTGTPSNTYKQVYWNSSNGGLCYLD